MAWLESLTAPKERPRPPGPGRISAASSRHSGMLPSTGSESHRRVSTNLTSHLCSAEVAVFPFGKTKSSW